MKEKSVRGDRVEVKNRPKQCFWLFLIHKGHCQDEAILLKLAALLLICLYFIVSAGQ